jgi:hypothetical protein
MKKTDLTPGTKVIASIEYGDEWSDEESKIVRFRPDEYDDYTLVGVVRSKEAAPGKVYVKWIEGELADDAEGEDSEGEEVDIKVLGLLSERTEMEKEFKAVQKQVKEKMKAAAALIKEAGKMADKAGLPSLANMYDVSSPLVDAMDNNGWRSSSWGC